jgi:hypothetical protein
MNFESPFWFNVEQAILAHHHQPDLEGARVLYAAVAAHRLKGNTVWPMLVAPPGSMKTELLGGLDGLPNVHFVDQITPQTFISGHIPDPMKPAEASASLLHRIGASGVLIYPDFSTILAMKGDKKASVLADMRRIYDGKLRKEFGTGDNLAEREWSGRITFVVAVTGEIDRHYSIFQTLGERFVMVRWPRAGGIETALSAMNQDNQDARAALSAAVHELMGNLPSIEPTIPRELQIKIAALTEIAVRGRTHVPRAGRDKEVIYIPEPESATRLAQQLAQLAKGSALLDARPVVNEADYAMVRRVAFDCMPPVRGRILGALIAGDSPRTLNIPGSTRHYAEEELKAQGLLDGSRLSELAVDMLDKAGYSLTGFKAA